MEDFFKNAMNCLEALFVNAIVEFARWWWWWKLFQCSWTYKEKLFKFCKVAPKHNGLLYLCFATLVNY